MAKLPLNSQRPPANRMAPIRIQSDQNQNRAEYQRFPVEYFTGADTYIYFGNIWIDEISGIEFAVQANTVPIYGYNSYTADAFAHGTRVVTGSFRMALRQAGYLYQVMDNMENSWKQGSGDVLGSMAQESLNQQQSPIQYSKRLPKAEDLISAGKESPDTFDIIAEMFEKAIWGEKTTVSVRAPNRSNQPLFLPSHSKLKADGFTIHLVYGTVPQAIQQKLNAPWDYGTVRRLNGVRLTGCRQVVNSDGAAVEEEYSFIAADLDGETKKPSSCSTDLKPPPSTFPYDVWYPLSGTE